MHHRSLSSESLPVKSESTRQITIRHGVKPASHVPSINALRATWARRWIVVACALLAAAGTIAYLAQATPLFRASAQVYVYRTGPRILSHRDVLGQDVTSMRTHCDLIRSSAVLTAALKLPMAQQAGVLKTWAAPVTDLQSRLQVTSDIGSDIVTVSLDLPDAQDAAALVNAVVEAYVAYQEKQQQSNAAEVLRILQAEKTRREGEYRTLTSSILAFKRARGVLWFGSSAEGQGGDEDSLTRRRLEELSDLVSRAQVQTLDARLALQGVEALSQWPGRLQAFVRAQQLAAELRTRNSGDLEGDQRRLERQIVLLRSQYGPDHPAIAAVAGQLRLLELERKRLDDASVEDYRALLQQQYQLALQKEQALRSQLQAEREQVYEQNVKAAELGQMQADLRRTERMLDLIDNRIRELDINSDAGALQVSLLEPARAGTTTVWPNRPKVLVLGLILGVVAGIAVALTMERLDPRVRSTEEAADAVQVPVIGVIPHLEGRTSPLQRGRELQLNPHSSASEAYRGIRTGIDLSADAAAHKILLVASPSVGDGKTTVAANLAIAMAQLGRRVLLIDGDCRRPMLNRIFDVDPVQGLATVLSGEAAVQDAVVDVGIHGLHLLPCGKLPGNPAEMLSGPHLRELLEELSGQYDQIVIDSPPVAAVSDARLLASVSDQVVLVVRAERTARRLAEHARTALISVGGQLLGTIVNDAPRTSPYYASYYYGDRDRTHGSPLRPGRQILNSLIG